MRRPSAQQQLFIDYLLLDPDMVAVRAAEKAGYAYPKTEGARLMKLPHIAAAVKAAMDARAARVATQWHAEQAAVEVQREAVRVSQDAILHALDRIVGSDVRKLVKPDDKSPFAEMLRGLDDDTASAIASIDVEFEPGEPREMDDGATVVPPPTVTSLKVKFWDKTAALNLAMRHRGMFKADNDQQGKSFTDLVLAAQRIREARAKADEPAPAAAEADDGRA